MYSPTTPPGLFGAGMLTPPPPPCPPRPSARIAFRTAACLRAKGGGRERVQSEAPQVLRASLSREGSTTNATCDIGKHCFNPSTIAESGARVAQRCPGCFRPSASLPHFLLVSFRLCLTRVCRVQEHAWGPKQPRKPYVTMTKPQATTGASLSLKPSEV